VRWFELLSGKKSQFLYICCNNGKIPLICWLTSGKLLIPSEICFPYLQNKDRWIRCLQSSLWALIFYAHFAININGKNDYIIKKQVIQRFVLTGLESWGGYGGNRFAFLIILGLGFFNNRWTIAYIILWVNTDYQAWKGTLSDLNSKSIPVWDSAY
jgi:hypothetical protein